MTAHRTLTVCSESGLSNRLRVLLSGLALAEASGRDFRMHWPRTAACGCPFRDLFEAELPVVEGEAGACAHLPLWGGVGQPWSDLLQSPAPHLALRSPDWLIRPSQYPMHAALRQRCVALWHGLRPIAPLQQRIDDFQREHFRPRMIGLHLRRGDFRRARPDVLGSTRHALQATRAFLNHWPDAGVFLCTDDGAPDPVTGQSGSEGLRARFQAAFGERVVFTTPRSLDRRSPAAIQDAVVDLYLLRRVDRLVATRDSTFSELAAFGREVETVWCRPGGAYPWVAAAGNLTGLFPLVRLLGRLQFHRRVPEMILLSYYAGRAKRGLARLTRTRSSHS